MKRYKEEVDPVLGGVSLYQLPLWWVDGEWAGLGSRRRSEVLTRAGYHGDMATLEFVRHSGCPLIVHTMWAAAAGGQVGLLQWGRAHGCEWDPKICLFAARFGRLSAAVGKAERVPMGLWSRDNMLCCSRGRQCYNGPCRMAVAVTSSGAYALPETRVSMTLLLGVRASQTSASSVVMLCGLFSCSLHVPCAQLCVLVLDTGRNWVHLYTGMSTPCSHTGMWVWF